VFQESINVSLPIDVRLADRYLKISRLNEMHFAFLHGNPHHLPLFIRAVTLNPPSIPPTIKCSRSSGNSHYHIYVLVSQRSRTLQNDKGRSRIPRLHRSAFRLGSLAQFGRTYRLTTTCFHPSLSPLRTRQREKA
jgi:hypothetical protein